MKAKYATLKERYGSSKQTIPVTNAFGQTIAHYTAHDRMITLNRRGEKQWDGSNSEHWEIMGAAQSIADLVGHGISIYAPTNKHVVYKAFPNFRIETDPSQAEYFRRRGE